MSNAKWRKFFQVVNKDSLELNMCTWKLINEDNSLPGHLPDYHSLGDDYVGDCGALNGRFEFKFIEWLLIPTKHGYQPYEKTPVEYTYQNLDKLIERLDTIGLFEYEITEEGLKIYGFKP